MAARIRHTALALIGVSLLAGAAATLRRDWPGVAPADITCRWRPSERLARREGHIGANGATPLNHDLSAHPG